MNAIHFLYAAYIITWVILLGYIGVLTRARAESYITPAPSAADSPAA